MEVRDAGENYTTSLRSWNCTPFCRIRGILPRRAGQNLPPSFNSANITII